MNYDQLAYLYDDENSEHMLWNKYIERYTFFKYLPSLEGKEVLELGTSAGIIAKYCLDHGAKEVVGIDVSPLMVNYAQKRNKGHFRGLVADLKQFVKLDQNFDVVLSSLTLHYVKDWSNVFKMLKAYLKPQGKLMIQIENHEWVYRDQKEHYQHNDLIIDMMGKDNKKLELKIYFKNMADVIKELEVNHFHIDNIIYSEVDPALKVMHPNFYNHEVNNKRYVLIQATKVK